MKHIGRSIAIVCIVSAVGFSLLGSVPASAAPPVLSSLPHVVRTTLSPSAGQDYAGSTTAADSDTIAVGAGESVSLYALTAAPPSTETPLVTLADPTHGTADNFGGTVAIDGNLLVVGADLTESNSVLGAGVVYVYQRPAGGWADVSAPIATIVSPNPTHDGEFGHAIALESDSVVVGAPYEAAEAGVVYVFTEPATGWEGSAPGYATLSSPEVGSEAGSSLAVDGDIIVAGAPDLDTILDNTGGAAMYVEPSTGWKNAGPTWQFEGELATDQYMGESVAFDGAYLALGGDGGTAGRVDIFAQPTAGWAGGTGGYDDNPYVELTDPALASTAYFGNDLAMNASEILVGAPFATIGSATSAGLVDAFAMPAGGWAASTTPAYQLTDQDPLASDSFGVSLLLAGNRLVVGAGDDYSTVGDAGRTYLYTSLPIPALTKVSESHKSWKRDTKLPALNPKKAVKGGTKLRFTANQSMPVTLSFQRRKNGKYGAAHKLMVTAKDGKNVLYFGGRLTKKTKLATGKFRVAIRGKNAAGDSSSAPTLHFTIKAT